MAETEIGLYFEGNIMYGREGSVSLINVVDGNKEVYVFDIQVMGADAFTKGGLCLLLEDDSILKVRSLVVLVDCVEKERICVWSNETSTERRSLWTTTTRSRSCRERI